MSNKGLMIYQLPCYNSHKFKQQLYTLLHSKLTCTFLTRLELIMIECSYDVQIYALYPKLANFAKEKLEFAARTSRTVQEILHCYGN